MSDAVISKRCFVRTGRTRCEDDVRVRCLVGPDSIHPYPCGDVRPQPGALPRVRQSDETVDPLGPAPVKTTHCYNTGRSASELIMTGRERETWVWGPGGIEAGSTPAPSPGHGNRRPVGAFGVRLNYLQTPNTSSVPYPYFVFLDRKDEYLRSGQGTPVRIYTYDCQAMPSSCYGLLTLTHAEGDPASSNDDTDEHAVHGEHDKLGPCRSTRESRILIRRTAATTLRRRNLLRRPRPVRDSTGARFTHGNVHAAHEQPDEQHLPDLLRQRQSPQRLRAYQHRAVCERERVRRDSCRSVV